MLAGAVVAILALGTGCAVTPPGPGAPAAGAIPPAFEGRLAAVGTEPFWSIDLVPEGPDRGIHFSDFSAAVPREVRLDWVAPEVTGAGQRVVFRARDLTVTLTAAPCSDGMSDIRYPMQADVQRPGQAPLRGCGYQSWIHGVEAALPAIDACLLRRPGWLVSWAGADPARTGNTLVLLDRAGGGERRACTVDAAGAASMVGFAAETGEQPPGVGNPTLVRAPMAVPDHDAGEGWCRRLHPVRGRDGAEIGTGMVNHLC
jgi:uncharacterized membrane protein